MKICQIKGMKTKVFSHQSEWSAYTEKTQLLKKTGHFSKKIGLADFFALSNADNKKHFKNTHSHSCYNRLPTKRKNIN